MVVVVFELLFSDDSVVVFIIFIFRVVLFIFEIIC